MLFRLITTIHKKIYKLPPLSIVLFLTVLGNNLFGQTHLKVGTNVGSLSPSAVFEAASTTKGMLIPRMTTAEMNAISSPANGLMVYNTTIGCIHIYQTSAWVSTCSASYAAAWGLTGNAGTNTTTNFIGTTDNTGLVFRTNNTERMRLTTAGYLGIGTTAPISPIHVQNDGLGSGLPDDVIISSYGTSVNPAFVTFSARGTAAAPANLQNDDKMGNISFYGYANGSFSQPISQIQARYKGNGTTSLTNLEFYTSNTLKAILNENGNFGIGNSTPAYRLDVDAQTGSSGNPLRLLGLNAGASTDSLLSSASGVVRRLHPSALNNSFWSLTGNAGTLDGTNFLGTTDNVALSLRVNNQRSGYIDPTAVQSTFFGYRAGLNTTASKNSAFGANALTANTTGEGNTAIGAAALTANTTGGNNTAVGINVLQTATNAGYNVAIGESAMSLATGGSYNTVVGNSALNNNTTGTNNVALGLFTLQSNTTGTYNIAVGSHTLIGNTIGGGNIGMGHYTLRNNTSGEYNVGIGRGAMEGATTANYNVAIGYFAMGNATTTGNSNVGIGEFALYRNTTGFDNIGIGRTALSFNNAGQNNIGIGAGAVYANTTGSNNIGLGTNALNAAISATNNTVVGVNAAQFTTGGSNTAMGFGALNLNTTGTNNVAFGVNTGATNTTGSNNTFLGYQANTSAVGLTNATAIGANATVGASNSLVLGNNVNVGINTNTPQYKLDIDAITASSGNPLRLLGLSAGASTDSLLSSASGVVRRLHPSALNNSFWSLTGNTGTVDGTNFIGTIDNAPLNFRVNNQKAGRVDHNNNNTSYGYFTFNALTTGTYNTAFGQSAMMNLTTGSNNTAFGVQAMGVSTTGNGNVAIGLRTFLGGSGNNNVAIGTYAMETGTASGNNNVAIGHLSAYQHTTGTDNTFVGSGTAYRNTTGSQNVFLGRSSGATNIVGNQNTYVGVTSGAFTTGNNSTMMGYNAGYNTTTGGNNTFIGHQAGLQNTTGANNTALGYGANFINNNLTNATAIGYNASVGASNSLVLGNSVNVGINTSTPQYKLDIDAMTGSSGNPIRLRGLNIGTNSDSMLTASAGVVRQIPISMLITRFQDDFWGKEGNGGTDPAINFAGTTDNNAFVLRTNNVERARITEGGNLGVNTDAPNSSLQVNGSFSTAITTRTTAYSATATDHIIIGNAATGAFNVTLPTAVGIAGRQYIIKKTDATANAVTVTTTGGQTIDGATTVTISIQWQSKTVVSDGTNWLIISNQ
jgi:hypothetical protein